jgi:hypothetical protein
MNGSPDPNPPANPDTSDEELESKRHGGDEPPMQTQATGSHEKVRDNVKEKIYQ